MRPIVSHYDALAVLVPHTLLLVNDRDKSRKPFGTGNQVADGYADVPCGQDRLDGKI